MKCIKLDLSNWSITVSTTVKYFTLVVGTTTTHGIRITITNKDLEDFNKAEKETFLKAVCNRFTCYLPDSIGDIAQVVFHNS